MYGWQNPYITIRVLPSEFSGTASGGSGEEVDRTFELEPPKSKNPGDAPVV